MNCKKIGKILLVASVIIFFAITILKLVLGVAEIYLEESILYLLRLIQIGIPVWLVIVGGIFLIIGISQPKK